MTEKEKTVDVEQYYKQRYRDKMWAAIAEEARQKFPGWRPRMQGTSSTEHYDPQKAQENMSDKQKIRAEVKRLWKWYFNVDINAEALHALDKVRDFIDSMPEESADNLNEIAASWVGVHRWNIKDYNGNIEKGYSYDDMLRMFKRGAFWQMDQYESKLSYLPITEAGKAYEEWEKTQPKPINPCLAFHRGEQWCKQQLTKDAVDGVVHCFGDDEIAAVHYNDPKGVPMSYFVSSKGLKAGDRVKVIIIKED